MQAQQNDICTGCHRSGDFCICGRKSNYWRCACCQQDVGKETAIWVKETPQGSNLPLHEDCVTEFLRTVGGTIVPKAPPISASLRSPTAVAVEDTAEVACVVDLPLRIIAREKPDKIALKMKEHLVETFHAMLTAANAATYTYDAEKENVRIEGFQEMLRTMLSGSDQLRPM